MRTKDFIKSFTEFVRWLKEILPELEDVIYRFGSLILSGLLLYHIILLHLDNVNSSPPERVMQQHHLPETNDWI
jgi:hypothetical protein